MVSKEELPPLLQIGDVLVSMDCITEHFCCDLDVCKGACCIEGDAGAPISMDEVLEIEDVLDDVWDTLPASSQEIISRNGVCTIDATGELVTPIIENKDCAFAFHTHNGCCMCAFENAWNKGTCNFPKPISCALYPIREKTMSNGLVALNYDRWDICRCAREKGETMHLPVYQFLKEPLIRRFGNDWYQELELTIAELRRQGMLD